MTDDLRQRETIKTVLKRHRQASRMLAEASQSQWREFVASGRTSGKYHQLAATTAELARLLAPKITDTEYWDKELTTVEAERIVGQSQEVDTVNIGVTLQWLACSNGRYEDLQYDGPEPFEPRGMLSNVTPPKRVEIPIPPSAVRVCHQALTGLMDEFDILDYGSKETTEYPEPV